MNMEFLLWIFTWSIFANPLTNGFNIGVRRTSCSLDRVSYNDPCDSLYGAICDGKHCKCPPNSHEDKTLRKCSPGTPKAGSGGDLFDLPFDYVPDQKPKGNGQKDPTGGGRGPSTNRNQPAYPHPRPTQQPAPAGGYNNGAGKTNWHGGYPKQTNHIYPGYPRPGYPNQPASKYPLPGNPYQPGYPPDQPSYPNRYGYPNQPGHSNLPGSGYPIHNIGPIGLQPGMGYPKHPGSYPTHRPRRPIQRYGGGDPLLGHKTGGGIAGGIGIIILLALAYFCCCNKAKGKEMLSKLPFMKGSSDNTYAMQQQQQQPYPTNPNAPPAD